MAIKTTDEELKALQQQVVELQSKLKDAEEGRTTAEEMAMALTQAGPFIGNTEEQATGKTVTVSVCLNPAVKDEKKLKYKDVEVPTYFYAIDLPAGAGICLTTNGIDFYHGQTYEVDPYQLAELKSRVARCWDHEKSIHGTNENQYRKPTNKHLMTAAAAQMIQR